MSAYDDLLAWANEEPSQEELDARRAAEQARPFNLAERSVHKKADPRYGRRTSSRSDGGDDDRGDGDWLPPGSYHYETAPAATDEVLSRALYEGEIEALPYNRFLDTPSEAIHEELKAKAARIARARKPRGRAAAEKELRVAFRQLSEPDVQHMLAAARWHYDREELHRCALRAMQRALAVPKRQARRHVSPGVRAEIIRIYDEGREAGLTDRAIYREIRAATGIPRSTVQGWVAEFRREQTNPQYVGGEDDDEMQAEMLETIRRENREEHEKTRSEIFQVLYVFRHGETPAETWEAFLAERSATDEDRAGRLSDV